jgi:hypothetical protein
MYSKIGKACEQAVIDVIIGHVVAHTARRLFLFFSSRR